MLVENLYTTDGIELKGPLLLKPDVFEDRRGFFFESWNKKKFEDRVQKKVTFVQDNHSKSCKGVLRGLHYQIPPMDQGKLVRCILGEIFDVAVDIRQNSPTFGKWISANLSGKNYRQLWIPSGFAHGFLTISEEAEVLYKTDNYWSSKHERSLRWNDNYIDINWPLNITPNLSKKDSMSKLLKETLKEDLL